MTADRAAALAFRRRLTEAAARRHPPRGALPPPAQPRGAIVQYTSALSTLSKAIDDALLDELADAGLVPVRTDAAEGGAPSLPKFNPRDIAARLERIAKRIIAKHPIVTTLESIAGNVQAFSKGQVNRQIRALLGVDLPAAEPDLVPIIKKFRVENTDLITSLAKDKVRRVHTILAEAGSGTRVEDIRRRVMDEFGVAKSRADLIARDQVLKLNAKVTKTRHEKAGITQYRWRTAGDASVRKAHADLNGLRFRYDDPPLVDAKRGRCENPGEDYQCRCRAEAVIPGYNDAWRASDGPVPSWYEPPEDDAVPERVAS